MIGLFLSSDQGIFLTSLSWFKFNTPVSLHHGFGWLKLWRFVKCRHWLLLMMQFLKTPRKHRLKFFIPASWGVFACRIVVSMQRFFVQFYQFKNVNALIALSYRDLPVLVLEIFNTVLGWYWNFSFIVSELVQVSPDNSLAECVNL